jgi:hypothetical protein
MVPLYKFFHIKSATTRTIWGTTNLSHVPLGNMNGTPLHLTLQEKLPNMNVCALLVWKGIYAIG